MKKLGFITLLMFVAMTAMAFAGSMDLVPQDSALVVGLNVGKLITTETIKKQIDEGLAKQTPEQKKAYDEFVAKTGFDPLKDLKEVHIFAGGKADAKSEKPKGGLLITGNINPAKILEAFKADPNAAKDAEIVKFEGLDAIKSKKDQESIGVFLDNTTAFVGTPEMAKAVVEVKTGKAKNIAANADFANVLKKADTSASIWGVGLAPAQLKEQMKANPQFAPLAAVNALFFAFNYENGINFNFTGEVTDKKDLDGVMTSLNGFVAMIKMMAGQTPEAAEILALIKVEALDSAAKVSLMVPQAKLDEVRKKLEEKMKSGAATPGAAPAPAAGEKKEEKK